MKPSSGVFVALGSNLGDPVAQLRCALAELDRLPSTRLRNVSSFYRTPPWGEVEQPDFVNAVAEIETALAPLVLLDALLSIEQRMGRVRDRRNGPRVIDLDLLLHGDNVLDSAQLTIPHPRMHDRAFVLWPLAEIAPDLNLVGHGRVCALAGALEGAGIERLRL